MFTNRPRYLSAAVMYENLVVQSYSQPNVAFPLVAVYPKEGTFWSDHPVGIVDREWMTPERREAAEIYIKFLLDRPQQLAALKYGFRPGPVEIPVTSPIDTAHGVDPRQPKTVLDLPNTATVGKDTTSKLTLDQLLAQIRYDFDQHTIRVFTIGYEAEEGTDVLKQISEVTQGRYYEGKQTNIREILRIFRRSFKEFPEGSRFTACLET